MTELISMLEKRSDFKFFPEVFLLFLKLFLLPWIHLFSFAFAFQGWKARQKHNKRDNKTKTVKMWGSLVMLACLLIFWTLIHEYKIIDSTIRCFEVDVPADGGRWRNILWVNIIVYLLINWRAWLICGNMWEKTAGRNLSFLYFWH